MKHPVILGTQKNQFFEKKSPFLKNSTLFEKLNFLKNSLCLEKVDYFLDSKFPLYTSIAEGICKTSVLLVLA